MGEIAEKVSSWQLHLDADREDAKSEIGDTCWYIATVAQAFDLTLNALPKVSADYRLSLSSKSPAACARMFQR